VKYRAEGWGSAALLVQQFRESLGARKVTGGLGAAIEREAELVVIDVALVVQPTGELLGHGSGGA
jgi:hypothetical protein